MLSFIEIQKFDHIYKNLLNFAKDYKKDTNETGYLQKVKWEWDIKWGSERQRNRDEDKETFLWVDLFTNLWLLETL